eukprot:13500021-Alexandrium_andersonii.AAC.1
MIRLISSSMSSKFASGTSCSPMSDIWSLVFGTRASAAASRHRLGPALGLLLPGPRAARGGRT